MRWAVALVSLAVTVSVQGCSFDEVRLRAAHDLECAAAKLETQQIDDSRVRISGCGRSATYYCGVDSRGFDACTREKPNPRADVQNTAANDLRCPPHKIAIDDIKDGFAASGCGVTANYACREVAAGFRCQALTTPVPIPPPKQPPR